MRTEQKPGVIPQHRFTITDAFNTAGIPHSPSNRRRLERLIGKNHNLIASLTDPEGHVKVSSPVDFAALVELISGLKEENSSLRLGFESATLPDGSKITARKIFPILQITAIVTKAREKKQPFSLEQIINALDPTPKRSKESIASAKKQAIDAISMYRRKIEEFGWVIDRITSRKDAEGMKNPQFWFRHKDEPPFTPLPDTEALAKKRHYASQWKHN